MPAIDDQGVRRTVRTWVIGLLAFSVLLGVLHVMLHELREGGIYWFNLDKERNVATWFNGVVFMLFGFAAFLAYYQEGKRNSEGGPWFRLPFLWLGIGVVALWMSLDEITILHENLLWREVRLFSDTRGDAWKYVTQWQILFAPAILLVIAYFAVFFSNRFAASRQARRLAFAGVGCWIAALLLEGVRGTIREASGALYVWQVLIEEQLEIVGGILLLAAVVSYVLDIALDFDDDRRRSLETRSRFLTRGAVGVTSAGVILIVVAAGTIYLFASRQARAGDPVPGLFRRAVREQTETTRAPLVSSPPIEPPEAPAIWFDDLGPLPAVDDDALGRYVVSRLTGRGPATAIPAELERDAGPRIVFLSISDGAQRARIVTGAAKGLGTAIDRATAEAKNAGLVVDGGWMKVDVVNFVDPEDRLASNPPFPIDLGIHGLAFGGPWGVAFTPDELVSYGLLTGKMDLDGKEMHRYLEYKDPTSARYFLEMLRPRTPVPYRLFTTKSWFIESGEAVPLYRGHRTYESVTATQLRDSAIRGGDYLIRSVRDDGSFAYSYFPVQDSVASSYNMLRHAGTIYAMLELYEVTRNPALLAEAERAIGFLVGKVRPCGEEEQYLCVVDNDAIKLGGNALAIIALTLHRELTGDDSHRDLMKSMVGWIKSVQSPEGEFVIHKISYPEEVVQDFTSQYYPGETLLALARLYVQERDESLIESASKGAKWLIDVRDAGKGVDDLAHDHWLLYALNEILRLTEDPAILEHAMKISEAIVGSQNLDPAFKDWLGSYYRPPRSTPTAIRTEGLSASYALARDFDRPEMAERILDALKLGLRFDLQTQFGPEKSMYFGDPQRALGGFGKSLTVFEIRIDYVQHNISALLAVADILDERERQREE